MPLANRLLELLLLLGGAVSRARLIKNASRSSSMLNCAEVWLLFCDCIASALACEGGRRIQTTHHPRLVLHVRSISERLRRVLVIVASIWECTLRASIRLQPEGVLLLLLRPSAMSVPGSGMFGRLECTV